MKRVLAATTIAAVMFSVSAASLSSAHADVVKFGIIMPFSGPFAVLGKQAKEAVEAFQKLNGKTVNGHEVQVIWRDEGAGDAAKTRQFAEELILREKVNVLGGFALTPDALAVAEVISEAQTPTVILNAATSIIPRKSPYFIRVSMTAAQYISPLGGWATKNGVKTAYTMVSDYGPGIDMEGEFTSSFEKGGGKVVGKDRVPLNVTDFAPYMERALQSKADALFIFAPGGAPSVAMVREFERRGLKQAGMKLMGSGEMQEIFLPSFGDSVLGAISSNHYTESNQRPENIAFRKALNESTGREAVPDIVAVAAWDGMQLVYETVKSLGPKFTGDQAIDFMKKQTINSPRGPISFDPKERDIIQNVYVREVRKVDGKVINVDIATVEQVRDPWKDNNPNAK
ncbi:ABC transporter substrate-binding protein [Methylocella sp. CPCC 101449]|uniref:ABC transporter substrate-binding protein n=1 Tax=Methylocella sp. CPCC 101449 TaxID=2987531 RepID=UPI0028900F09|nr:ABC transporter substrate-binding protein [Methylocella sp. CPCC 101449]MDT2023325.1 ABC transporter substrate-binding protein [Methylocella sp. CPCC 101449]